MVCSLRPPLHILEGIRLFISFTSYWSLLNLPLGDNFFKTASYTIEALCARSFEDATEKLKEIEAQILRKRNDLREFEIEYRKVRNLTFPSMDSCMICIFWPHYWQWISRHWHVFRKSQTDTAKKNKLYVSVYLIFAFFVACFS